MRYPYKYLIFLVFFSLSTFANYNNLIVYKDDLLSQFRAVKKLENKYTGKEFNLKYKQFAILNKIYDVDVKLYEAFISAGGPKDIDAKMQSKQILRQAKATIAFGNNLIKRFKTNKEIYRVYLAIGRILYDLKKSNAAKSYIEYGFNHASDKDVALESYAHIAGDIYFKLKEYDKAAYYYKVLVDIENKKNPELNRYRLAYSYYHLGHGDKALKEILYLASIKDSKSEFVSKAVEESYLFFHLAKKYDTAISYLEKYSKNSIEKLTQYFLDKNEFDYAFRSLKTSIKVTQDYNKKIELFNSYLDSIIKKKQYDFIRGALLFYMTPSFVEDFTDRDSLIEKTGELASSLRSIYRQGTMLKAGKSAKIMLDLVKDIYNLSIVLQPENEALFLYKLGEVHFELAAYSQSYTLFEQSYEKRRKSTNIDIQKGLTQLNMLVAIYEKNFKIRNSDKRFNVYKEKLEIVSGSLADLKLFKYNYNYLFAKEKYEQGLEIVRIINESYLNQERLINSLLKKMIVSFVNDRNKYGLNRILEFTNQNRIVLNIENKKHIDKILAGIDYNETIALENENSIKNNRLRNIVEGDNYTEAMKLNASKELANNLFNAKEFESSFRREIKLISKTKKDFNRLEKYIDKFISSGDLNNLSKFRKRIVEDTCKLNNPNKKEHLLALFKYRIAFKKKSTLPEIYRLAKRCISNSKLNLELTNILISSTSKSNLARYGNVLIQYLDYNSKKRLGEVLNKIIIQDWNVRENYAVRSLARKLGVLKNMSELNDDLKYSKIFKRIDKYRIKKLEFPEDKFNKITQSNLKSLMNKEKVLTSIKRSKTPFVINNAYEEVKRGYYDFIRDLDEVDVKKQRSKQYEKELKDTISQLSLKLANRLEKLEEESRVELRKRKMKTSRNIELKFRNVVFPKFLYKDIYGEVLL